MLRPLQPYAMPDANYLKSLPLSLLEAAKADSLPDPVPVWSRSMPFEIPTDYVEGLSAGLAAAAAQTLPDPPATMPFRLPDGYLTGLPEQLLAAAKAAAPPPRRIPLLRRVAPWLAAAAVMSGVWFGVTRESAPVVPAEQQVQLALTGVSNDSIGAWVEQHVDEFDAETLEDALAGGGESDLRQAVSELRNDEIENYLNDAGPETTAPDGI